MTLAKIYLWVKIAERQLSSVLPIENAILSCYPLNVSGKIKSLEALKEIAAAARKDGKTVVFTNGCFDLLHRGHVHILREAKACGDILIVGVNSDNGSRIGTLEWSRFMNGQRSVNVRYLYTKENNEDVPVTELGLLPAFNPRNLAAMGQYTDQSQFNLVTGGSQYSNTQNYRRHEVRGREPEALIRTAAQNSTPRPVCLVGQTALIGIPVRVINLGRMMQVEGRVVLPHVIQAPAKDAQDRGQEGDVHQLVRVDAPSGGIAKRHLNAGVQAERDHDPVPMDLEAPDRDQHGIDPDLDQHGPSLMSGDACQTLVHR